MRGRMGTRLELVRRAGCGRRGRRARAATRRRPNGVWREREGVQWVQWVRWVRWVQCVGPWAVGGRREKTVQRAGGHEGEGYQETTAAGDYEESARRLMADRLAARAGCHREPLVLDVQPWSASCSQRPASVSDHGWPAPETGIKQGGPRISTVAPAAPANAHAGRPGYGAPLRPAPRQRLHSSTPRPACPCSLLLHRRATQTLTRSTPRAKRQAHGATPQQHW